MAARKASDRRVQAEWMPLLGQLFARPKQPEVRLAAAILLQALRDIRCDSLVLKSDARAWVESERVDDGHAFTFTRVCGILGRHVERTRTVALSEHLKLLRGSRRNSATGRMTHARQHRLLLDSERVRSHGFQSRAVGR